MILTHLVLFSFFDGASDGVVVAQTPANSVVLAPGFDPGRAPRVGERLDAQVDRNFEILAKISNVSSYLEDVTKWVAEVEGTGDEPVDVFADDFDVDMELFGRGRRWDRNRS